MSAFSAGNSGGQRGSRPGRFARLFIKGLLFFAIPTMLLWQVIDWFDLPTYAKASSRFWLGQAAMSVVGALFLALFWATGMNLAFRWLSKRRSVSKTSPQ
jgi:hypothetical protein